LPVWLAVMVERLLVLLIPVIGVIYPLVQILLSLYDKAMRKRIYRLYGELRFLEKDVESRREGQSIVDLNDRLDQLEEKTSRLQVPATYMSMLYTLRDHIIVVRGRLKRP
jgi:hypothetical protein